jgi:hypothetical protein
MTYKRAAEYVQVTMEEMETFLKRAFYALHPKKTVVMGNYVFDLGLSPTTGVRVWSSIPAGSGVVKDVGETPIKVQLYSFRKGKQLKPGKAPMVKRVKGWRDNLKDRIEDCMEDYDTHEDDIEAGRFVTW